MTLRVRFPTILLPWLLASTPGLAHSQAIAHRSTAFVATLDLTKQLGADALPLDGGLSLGAHWPLSAASALIVEIGYSGLGNHKERSHFESLFPPPVTHYLSTTRTRRLLRAALGLDYQLTGGRLRPHLLVGLNGGAFYGEYRSISRDSTGTVLSSIHNQGWGKALGPHLGLGLEWAGLGEALVPGIQARAYGLLTDAGDGWSGLTFGTLGITLRH